MYLWDSNMVRYYGEGHPNIRLYLQRVRWSDIALPSVVVAEVLRGRCDFALKAIPTQAPLAHELLLKTWRFLDRFNVIVFDRECGKALEDLQQLHKAHKRYADLMIAAIVLAGKHVLVTRNEKDFATLLSKSQIANWVDEKPS